MHASVDDIQKYADDTRTTCRRHVTRGFCPKMGKKKFDDAQIAQKKVSDDGYANRRYFFFSLRDRESSPCP